MPTFRLSERTSEPDAVTLTEDHFGINVVTTYDQEFGQLDTGLADMVGQMQAGTLRFPGGSATENYFDMTDPNATHSKDGNNYELLPMDDFFAAAATIDAKVQLVIPTQVGFALSATEALRAGSYGQRDQLAETYLADVEAYVRQAFAEAAANGIEISVLEIGNEFWGSGEMAAAEYGWLAGRVAVHLESILEDLGANDGVRIAAQSTAAASQIYSARDDQDVFIEIVHGEEKLRSQAYVDKHFGGTPPDHYEPVTIPGQGSAAGQLNALVDQINAVPGAADALDGVILHLYQRKGLDYVDDGRGYVFEQLEAFENRLDRAPDAPDMTYHLTEWNAATGNRADNAGLQHASMLIETIYEMATHNVTDAQVWPLTFNAAQGTSMVDLNDQRLAIAGEMYKLMAESLPDLDPILDWSVQDVIDIHGFANDARAVLFVSERSGEQQTSVRLNTGEVFDEGKYIIATTQLWDGGAGGDDDKAAPEITYMKARTGSADKLWFDIDDWANIRIELTKVSYLDDEITTYDANDKLYTYGGDDIVSSGGGSDFIHTGNGNDIIDAGDGRDWIIGGAGDDVMDGGAGRDMFLFNRGDGQDVINNFEFGLDRLQINDVKMFSFADVGDLQEAEFTFENGGLILSYGDGDHVQLTDAEGALAAEASGRILGSKRADILRGSESNDDLRGYSGSDYLEDGAGRDFLRGGNGADLFVLAADGEVDVIVDFEQGRDLIDLTAWGVGAFTDLTVEVERDANGDATGRGFIRHEDEELRIDTMDEEMAEAFNYEDVLL